MLSEDEEGRLERSCKILDLRNTLQLAQIWIFRDRRLPSGKSSD